MPYTNAKNRYVLRNEPSGLYYTFVGPDPHVERWQAHVFEVRTGEPVEDAAKAMAEILNGAGRGTYHPEFLW